MARGLAVIAELLNDKWIVYAIPKEPLHDKVIHTLRDDIRYGKIPILKFEIHYPNIIRDFIVDDFKYPDGFLEIKMGKKRAAIGALKAVYEYYIKNYDKLSEFTNDMLGQSDLSHANLVGATLYNSDLSGANLIGANLTKANLYNANLAGANLYNANLTDANLTDANLSYADLTNANLSRARLTGANMIGVKYDKCTIFPSNFTVTKKMVQI